MPLEFNTKTVAGLEVLEVPGEENGLHILLFHGYGAGPHDLLPLARIYIDSPRPTYYFPTGPHHVPIAPGYEGKGWYPLDIELMKQAIQEKNFAKISDGFPPISSEIQNLCQTLIAGLNIPLSHLVLGGFSQGAVLATDLALTLPPRIAALLIFSGILAHETSWKKLAPSHKNLPFFQSHGEHDPLLPFDQAQALEKLLLTSGLQGKLHPFRGGHEIPHSILLKLHTFLAALHKR